MKTIPVLASKHLPTRSPTLAILVAWLMLDRYQAPGWVHGVVWTLIGIACVGLVMRKMAERPMAPGELAAATSGVKEA